MGVRGFAAVQAWRGRMKLGVIMVGLLVLDGGPVITLANILGCGCLLAELLPPLGRVTVMMIGFHDGTTAAFLICLVDVPHP